MHIRIEVSVDPPAQVLTSKISRGKEASVTKHDLQCTYVVEALFEVSSWVLSFACSVAGRLRLLDGFGFEFDS
jgi:hypothetical protein